MASPIAKTKGFLTEFKEFALKGNVIDLAVAVVIGAAFNKIVSTFVSAIITPIMGYLTSGVNLSDLAYVMSPEGTPEADQVVLKYGELIQVSIDFVIIAFSIFVAIKVLSMLKRKEEAAPAPAPEPPAKSDEVVLLEEIRDLLKQKNN